MELVTSDRQFHLSGNSYTGSDFHLHFDLFVSFLQTVSRFLTLQKCKQEQCTNLCLRYIRARNAVNELDAVVKKLEMIGPGLYVYQFEQLHIDNQNLMTKIEGKHFLRSFSDRNCSFPKLR